MKKAILGLCFIATAGVAIADGCHPNINASGQNFIVGYGSLMNDASRQRTNSDAKNVYPVEVSGFERVWGLKAGWSYRTTGLLVIPKKEGRLNAVYYPVDYKGVLLADKRESLYCRYKIILPQ